MNDIELVIKIPEEVKNRLCFGVTYPKDIQVMCEALNNGTPLPKGHVKMVTGTRDLYKVDQINAILEAPDFYAYLSGDKTSGAKTINLDGFALKVLKALYEGKTITIKEASV